MARSPVAKALDAAAELDAWLARDPLPPVHPAGAGGPSRPDAGAGATGGAGEGNTRPSRPPPDAPAPVRHAGAVGMPHHPAPAHTDWLYHHLTVIGPADDVARLRAAAAGAGVVPWAMDWDRLEEDWAHPLLAPPPPQHRTLSAAGARVLAGELREAAQRRHEAALARVGRSKARPFDLHALVPVPGDVLALGRTTPTRSPGCGRIGAPHNRRATCRSARTWEVRQARSRSGRDGHHPVGARCTSPSGRPIGRRGGPSRGCAGTGRRCARTCARSTRRVRCDRPAAVIRSGTVGRSG